MSVAQQTQLRDDTLDLVSRLVLEYDGRVPPAVVIRCLSQVRWELQAVGLHDDLIDLTEQRARMRLDDRPGARGAA